jgi:hypothetical protein
MPYLRMRRLALIVACIGGVAVADEPPPPPEPSDRQVVVTEGPGLDVFGSAGSPLSIQFDMVRYVGPTDSDGYLRDVDELIDAGVVGKFVTIEIPVYDVDRSSGELDEVFINGQRVDVLNPSNSRYLHGSDQKWHRNKFKVPIKALKFPDAPGSGPHPPTPRRNILRVDVDTGGVGWVAKVDWIAVRFQAMSPIILVHGMNQSALWWSRHGFLDALRPLPRKAVDLPIPTWAGSTTRNARVGTNAAFLRTQIPQITHNFGCTSFHLVCHSKGGLDSRQFLTVVPASPIEPLSLSTLSTPHDGSILADYMLAVLGSAWVVPGTAPGGFDDTFSNLLEAQHWNNNTRAVAAATKIKNLQLGHSDLSLAACATFNALNVPMLPAYVHYIPVGSDLDLNNSGTLDTFAEAARLDLDSDDAAAVLAVPALGLEVMDVMYQELGKSTRLIVTPVLSADGTKSLLRLRALPSSGFLLNDILVTARSALGMGGPYKSVTERPVSGIDCYRALLGRNHSNIGDGGVARDVLMSVLQVEKTDGDMTP